VGAGLMDKAVIFDLDGTLADCSHRVHHVRHGKRDWNAFYAGIPDDPCVTEIRDLLYSLSQDNAVLLVSDRPEDYRCLTDN